MEDNILRAFLEEGNAQMNVVISYNQCVEFTVNLTCLHDLIYKSDFETKRQCALHALHVYASVALHNYSYV